MPGQSTTTTAPNLVEAAKAPFQAYAEKNWEAVKAATTPDFVYDEIATQRKATGHDQVIPLWQGWSSAFPDSKPTFHNSFVSGDTVILELTWTGTHTGTLQTPKGPIAPTGKKISIRSCNVMQMAEGKVKAQRQYFDMVTLMQQLGLA
jgi:steroid delta-isomerase-like uncharacterized protein